MTTALLAALVLIAAALLGVAVVVVLLAWVTVTTQHLDEDLDPAWWLDA